MALLTKNDPKPFATMNESGNKQVLLLCDHASYDIPESLNQLGLEPEELALHIACDYGAYDVTKRLSDRLNCFAITAGFSRLVVDCNRYPYTVQSIPSESDQVIVPRNVSMTRADVQRRMDEIFHPYHNCIEQHISEQLNQGTVPAIISIHSFTEYFGGMKRPWHIGLVWKEDPRMAVPFLHNIQSDPSLCIGDNEPYSGKLLAGYTTENHCEKNGLPHLLIEIRQDLINTEEKAFYWADVLYDAIQPICNNPNLYKQEYF